MLYNDDKMIYIFKFKLLFVYILLALKMYVEMSTIQ